MAQTLNKFEKSRLLGARALELSKGANPLVDYEKEGLSILLSRDLIRIAELEYKEGKLDLEIVQSQ